MNSRVSSQPHHGKISPVHASYHLIITDDSGGEAVAALSTIAPIDFFSNATIIYIDTQPEHNRHTRNLLSTLGCDCLYTFTTLRAALTQLRESLEIMHMGTQLYACGSTRLLELATKTAMQAGIDHQDLQTEHRGSSSRRVQCAHCKGMNHEVVADTVICLHCGLLLKVRDHYSRRLAAFQGVNCPSDTPTNPKS